MAMSFDEFMGVKPAEELSWTDKALKEVKKFAGIKPEAKAPEGGISYEQFMGAPDALDKSFTAANSTGARVWEGVKDVGAVLGKATAATADMFVFGLPGQALGLAANAEARAKAFLEGKGKTEQGKAGEEAAQKIPEWLKAPVQDLIKSFGGGEQLDTSIVSDAITKFSEHASSFTKGAATPEDIRLYIDTLMFAGGVHGTKIGAKKVGEKLSSLEKSKPLVKEEVPAAAVVEEAPITDVEASVAPDVKTLFKEAKKNRPNPEAQGAAEVNALFEQAKKRGMAPDEAAQRTVAESQARIAERAAAEPKPRNEIPIVGETPAALVSGLDKIKNGEAATMTAAEKIYVRDHLRKEAEKANGPDRIQKGSIDPDLLKQMGIMAGGAAAATAGLALWKWYNEDSELEQGKKQLEQEWKDEKQQERLNNPRQDVPSNPPDLLNAKKKFLTDAGLGIATIGALKLHPNLFKVITEKLGAEKGAAYIKALEDGRIALPKDVASELPVARYKGFDIAKEGDSFVAKNPKGETVSPEFKTQGEAQDWATAKRPTEFDKVAPETKILNAVDDARLAKHLDTEPLTKLGKDELGSADPKLLVRLGAAALGATAGASLSDNKLIGALVGGVGLAAATRLSPTRAASAVRSAFGADTRIRINDLANTWEAAIDRSARAIWQQQRDVVDIAQTAAERTAITHAVQSNTVGNLPPKLQAAARKASAFFAAMGEQGQKSGVLKGLIDNYVTNLWDLTGKNKGVWEQILEARGGASMSPESRFALKRSITSIEEGKKLGLTPVTEDVAEIMGQYGNSLARSIANKQLIDGLKERVDTAGGLKLVLPSTKAPHGYVALDHPQMNGVRVHPDIAPSLKFIFDNSAPGTISAGLQGLNTAIKRSAVSFSLFHAKALADAFVGAQGVIKGGLGAGKIIAQSVAPELFGTNIFLKQLREGGAGDLVDRLRSNGLKISMEKGKLADEDLNGSFYSALTGAQKFLDSTIPGAGLPVKGIVKLNHAVDTFMWERLHAAMKLTVAAEKLEVLTQADAKAAAREGRAPRTQDQLAEQASSFTNDIFGGLNWRRLAEEAHTKWGRDVALAAYSPTGRRVSQLLLFAPDWTVSTTRAAARMFGKALGYEAGSGVRGLVEPQNATDLHRQYVLRSAVYYAVVGDAINYSLSGHHLWENKDWTMIDMGDGRTMQWSKHSMEPVHWITKPGQQALNKLGFLPKEIANQALGTEYLSAAGRSPKMDTSLAGRGAHVLKSMQPIAAQQALGSNASVGGAISGFMGAPIYGKTYEEREAIKAQKKAEAALRRAQKRMEK